MTFSEDPDDKKEVDGPDTDRLKNRLFRHENRHLDLWIRVLEQWFEYYRERTENGLDLKKNITIICYENLKKNTVKEMTHLSKFLNLKQQLSIQNTMNSSSSGSDTQSLDLQSSSGLEDEVLFHNNNRFVHNLDL